MIQIIMNISNKMYKKILHKIAFCLILAGAFSNIQVRAADVQRGQSLVQQKNCASCHGADFKNTLNPEYPQLAGQKEDYLYIALHSYQVKDKNYGRENAIMQGQVKGLSAQDLKDIAAYLSTLPGNLNSPKH